MSASFSSVHMNLKLFKLDFVRFNCSLLYFSENGYYHRRHSLWRKQIPASSIIWNSWIRVGKLLVLHQNPGADLTQFSTEQNFAHQQSHWPRTDLEVVYFSQKSCMSDFDFDGVSQRQKMLSHVLLRMVSYCWCCWLHQLVGFLR